MNITWNDHAHHQLVEHINTPEPWPGNPHTNINDNLTQVEEALWAFFQDNINRAHLDHIVVTELGYAARSAKQCLEQIDMWSINRLHDLLIYKQTKYGHSNILAFGMIGIGIRACDKRARLNNLNHSNQGDMRDETIVDTYDDLIGYAVIAKMLYDGTFTTELAS